MCRAAALVNVPENIASWIADELKYGATLPPEFWRHQELTLVLNRYPVTSNALPQNSFPLVSQRLVLMMEGEVYGVGSTRFTDVDSDASDVHFALRMLESEGIDKFLEQADFEGTLYIFDKETGVLHVYVDSLNVRGCFYASYDGVFIAASEHAVVNDALSRLNAKDNVPIFVLPGGCGLQLTPGEQQPTVKPYQYLRDNIWSGDCNDNLHNRVNTVFNAICEATIRRIPKEGSVAVLCSGGVDSTLILKIVVDYLRNSGWIDRLVIIAFGDLQLDTSHEGNDLYFVVEICKQLEVMEYLLVIDPKETESMRIKLFQDCVYSKAPRLVTPNPVRTHIRHTVMMASVLAQVIQKRPDVMAIISGDAADELFAGYPSMYAGLQQDSDIVTNIREKLSDLPLNDLARVALASLHGCALATAINTHNTYSRPVELRHPYTSRLVLDALKDAFFGYLTAMVDGNFTPKFLLRLVAVKAGLPLSIALRRKIPFNEGATGLENAKTNPAELAQAQVYLKNFPVEGMLKQHESRLLRLGLVGRDSSVNPDYLGLYVAGLAAGLERLLVSNAFRERMPDAIYASEIDLNSCRPPSIQLTSSELLEIFP